jgi:hypothetical protein
MRKSRSVEHDSLKRPDRARGGRAALARATSALRERMRSLASAAERADVSLTLVLLLRLVLVLVLAELRYEGGAEGAGPGAGAAPRRRDARRRSSAAVEEAPRAALERVMLAEEAGAPEGGGLRVRDPEASGLRVREVWRRPSASLRRLSLARVGGHRSVRAGRGGGLEVQAQPELGWTVERV